MGTQYLGPSLGCAVQTSGAQVEVSSPGRDIGVRSPGSELNPLSQLACGRLWLSGYGPVWLQNATLLEQLGPTVSKLRDLQGRREQLGASHPTSPCMSGGSLQILPPA